MTVKELIDLLTKYPPDALVLVDGFYEAAENLELIKFKHTIERDFEEVDEDDNAGTPGIVISS